MGWVLVVWGVGREECIPCALDKRFTVRLDSVLTYAFTGSTGHGRHSIADNHCMLIMSTSNKLLLMGIIESLASREGRSSFDAWVILISCKQLMCRFPYVQ